jgi:hypothetical protein
MGQSGGEEENECRSVKEVNLLEDGHHGDAGLGHVLALAV